MTIIEQTGLLSNYWWAVIASDYSVSIFLAVTGIATLLKILAILIPGNRSDSIVDLLQGWLGGIPGVKKDEKGNIINGRRDTDTPKELTVSGIDKPIV
jgi:hypothetical protein